MKSNKIAKNKLFCKECNKEIIAIPSEIKRGNCKFCSRKCKGIWQSKNCIKENSSNWKKDKIKSSCKECNKELIITKTVQKNERGKFCSRTCAGKWRSKNFIGKMGFNWKGGKIKRNCVICNKEFFVKPGDSNSHKCCSMKCMGKWRSKTLLGENNFRWKDRDECRCLICKKSTYEHKRGKFCSNKCRGIWQVENNLNRNKWGESNCLVCGKKTYLLLLDIKSGKGKFCSHKCKGVWLKENKSGKNSYAWKGGEIKRVCDICQKEFYVKQCQVKKGWGKFCSRSCKSIWVVINMKTKDTSIEIAMEKELIKNKIVYKKHDPVEGITIADFLLKNKVIIQCDGDYWHSPIINKGKDARQDIKLKALGYKVFRFWEKDINKSPKDCLKIVLSYIKEREQPTV